MFGEAPLGPRERGLEHARRIALRTDRVKLARVLGNIVGNAIKSRSYGGPPPPL
jgi:hypothetical protein